MNITKQIASQGAGSSQTLTLVTAVGGLIGTAVTAAACGGPLIAIALGIGGFGWLAQYAALRVPASLATALLLAGGFRLLRRRAGDGECASRSHRVARRVLYVATAVAVVINVFEYLVFPHLA